MYPAQTYAHVDAVKALQKRWVGEEIRPGIYILDIGQRSTSGDIYVLCFNPANSVHKFVTWAFDPDRPASTSSGHYLFTIEEASDDMNARLGIGKYADY